MTREEIIDLFNKVRNHIINTYQPTNAKEFEILGRAIKGCECLTIMYDGTLYYPGKLKNTSADWEVKRLIDEAIKELRKCIESL